MDLQYLRVVSVEAFWSLLEILVPLIIFYVRQTHRILSVCDFSDKLLNHHIKLLQQLKQDTV